MTQTRLFLAAHGDAARRAYQALDAAFEEDGLPLAMTELDEATDRHEISVYADEDPDEIERRMRQTLEGLVPIDRIEREALPDIDWVAHSLEGLSRYAPDGSSSMAATTVTAARQRPRHRDRGRPGLRHRPSRDDRGLPGDVRRASSPAEKPRNALDLGTGSARIGDRGRKTRAYSRPGDRHRSGGDQGGEGQCPAERGSIAGSTRTATGFQDAAFAAKALLTSSSPIFWPIPS